MVDSQTILTDLKVYLQDHFSRSVKDVILFGSQAWGTPKAFSDFDILVVLDQAYSSRDENRILDLCYDIGLKYDILFDVHLLSKQEISGIRGKQPIFVNALRSGMYA